MSIAFRNSLVRGGSLLAVTLLAGVAGCNNPNDVSFNSVKSNLTPELQGMAERPVDVDRNMAVVGNQNLRMFWGDLGRLFFFDEPSPLSPWTAINTGGQPQ